MSDLRCPHCGDSFRVPDAEIPAGAIARCPWCQDAIPLSELISALPPMAQLTAADGRPLTLAPAGNPAVNSVLAGGDVNLEGAPQREGGPDLGDTTDTDDFVDYSADQSLAANESFSLAGELSEAETDGEPTFDAALPNEDSDSEAEYGAPVEPRPLRDFSDMTFARAERSFVTKPRVRKKSSPIRSVLGIVIGGLLAFPLAAGLLALYGRPLDLGFWPFDGRTIATGVATRTAAPLLPEDASARPAPPPGRSLADDMPSNLGALMASAEEDAQSEAIGPPQAQPDPSSPPPNGGAASQPATTSEATARMLNRRGQTPELVEPIVAEEEASEPVEATNEMPAQRTSQSAADNGAAQPSIEEFTDPSMPADREDTAATEPAVDTAAEQEPLRRQPQAPAEPAAEPGDNPAAEPSAIAHEAVAEVDPAAASGGTSGELAAALASLEQALATVQNEEGQDGRKGRLATLYASVAAVGEIATPQDEPELNLLVDRLEVNQLIKEIAPAAPNWAKYSQRPNDGMLAIGPLRREQEKWYLDWSGTTPLEVRSLDATTAKEGMQVLVLGRLVASETAPAIEAILVKPVQ